MHNLVSFFLVSKNEIEKYVLNFSNLLFTLRRVTLRGMILNINAISAIFQFSLKKIKLKIIEQSFSFSVLFILTFEILNF